MGGTRRREVPARRALPRVEAVRERPRDPGDELHPLVAHRRLVRGGERSRDRDGALEIALLHGEESAVVVEPLGGVAPRGGDGDEPPRLGDVLGAQRGVEPPLELERLEARHARPRLQRREDEQPERRRERGPRPAAPGRGARQEPGRGGPHREAPRVGEVVERDEQRARGGGGEHARGEPAGRGAAEERPPAPERLQVQREHGADHAEERAGRARRDAVLAEERQGGSAGGAREVEAEKPALPERPLDETAHDDADRDVAGEVKPAEVEERRGDEPPGLARPDPAPLERAEPHEHRRIGGRAVRPGPRERGDVHCHEGERDGRRARPDEEPGAGSRGGPRFHPAGGYRHAPFVSPRRFG